jgi:hypothetical protein
LGLREGGKNQIFLEGTNLIFFLKYKHIFLIFFLKIHIITKVLLKKFPIRGDAAPLPQGGSTIYVYIRTLRLRNKAFIHAFVIFYIRGGISVYGFSVLFSRQWVIQISYLYFFFLTVKIFMV